MRRSDLRRAEVIQSVDDARELASRRVPTSIFQTMSGGTGSNVTFTENERAFRDVMFRPRGAQPRRDRDLSTTVLGHEISMPAIVSSIGGLKIAHMDGEIGVTRAAGRAGTIQFVSGVSTTPIEDIVAAAQGPVFYQVYYIGGREATAPIIERAAAAGVAGLVLTVDTAIASSRAELSYRKRAFSPSSLDTRSKLRLAPQLIRRPDYLFDYLRRSGGALEPKVAMALRPDGEAMGFWEGNKLLYDEIPTWEDIAWIRKRWNGPLVIKGLLTADDARRAVAEGAEAVVVSNHGGNMLDGSRPTLRALPEIVDAVGTDIEVLIDGGVRRGVDVVKAVALGARAVLLGRAYLYPLMAAGEPGVDRILQLFREQIEQAMAFLGVVSLDELDSSYLDLPFGWPARTTIRNDQETT